MSTFYRDTRLPMSKDLCTRGEQRLGRYKHGHHTEVRDIYVVYKK
jgi:hypothetical protein